MVQWEAERGQCVCCTGNASAKEKCSVKAGVFEACLHPWGKCKQWTWQDSHTATYYGTKTHTDFGMMISFAVLCSSTQEGRKEGRKKRKRDINTKPYYWIFIFPECKIHSDNKCCAPKSLGHFWYFHLLLWAIARGCSRHWCSTQEPWLYIPCVYGALCILLLLQKFLFVKPHERSLPYPGEVQHPVRENPAVISFGIGFFHMICIYLSIQVESKVPYVIQFDYLNAIIL